MFDRWKLRDFVPGEGIIQGAHTTHFDHRDWLDITAPGDVHQTLIAVDHQRHARAI